MVHHDISSLLDLVWSIEYPRIWDEDQTDFCRWFCLGLWMSANSLSLCNFPLFPPCCYDCYSYNHYYHHHFCPSLHILFFKCLWFVSRTGCLSLYPWVVKFCQSVTLSLSLVFLNLYSHSHGLWSSVSEEYKHMKGTGLSP